MFKKRNSGNLYKDAIMDCCPNVEPPKNYKDFLENDNLVGKKLVINKKYLVSEISSGHMFPLIKKETDNFPGYEWKTRPVPTQGTDGKWWWCETSVTFHSDLKRWTGEVFLYSKLVSPDGLSTKANGPEKRLEQFITIEESM